MHRFDEVELRISDHIKKTVTSIGERLDFRNEEIAKVVIGPRRRLTPER